MRTFGVTGSYGIFYDGSTGGLFRRSLLWKRAQTQPSLYPIKFPSEQIGAPSWSWMAHRGSIDYLQTEGDCVTWREDEIKWQWVVKGCKESTTPQLTTRNSQPSFHLFAKSWGLAKGFTKYQSNVIVFDSPRHAEVESLRCVIVGRSIFEQQACWYTKYFVLIITHLPKEDGHWGRVGVGIICERSLLKVGSGVYVAIM